MSIMKILGPQNTVLKYKVKKYAFIPYQSLKENVLMIFHVINKINK